MNQSKAIQLIRNMTGCGLACAKDITDGMIAEGLVFEDGIEPKAPTPIVHSHPELEAVLGRIADALEADQEVVDAPDSTVECGACGDTGCEECCPSNPAAKEQF